MSKPFNPSMFRAIFQNAAKAVAAFSAGAINANISNRWASACKGASVVQRYISAVAKGGLAAPKPPQRV